MIERLLYELEHVQHPEKIYMDSTVCNIDGQIFSMEVNLCVDIEPHFYG